MARKSKKKQMVKKTIRKKKKMTVSGSSTPTTISRKKKTPGKKTAKKILRKTDLSIIVVNGSTQVIAGKLISLWKKIPIVVKYRGTLQMMVIKHPLYK